MPGGIPSRPPKPARPGRPSEKAAAARQGTRTRRGRTAQPRRRSGRYTFTRGPRELQQALSASSRPTQAVPEIPADFAGNINEWAVYWALLQFGKRPDVDFRFQVSRLGGRQTLGGAVVDFLMIDGSGIAINPQGLYVHYAEQESIVRDVAQRFHLSLMGIQLIWIDEDHLQADPLYYVGEALRGIDHSRGAAGTYF